MTLTSGFVFIEGKAITTFPVTNVIDINSKGAKEPTKAYRMNCINMTYVIAVVLSKSVKTIYLSTYALTVVQTN